VPATTYCVVGLCQLLFILLIIAVTSLVWLAEFKLILLITHDMSNLQTNSSQLGCQCMSKHAVHNISLPPGCTDHFKEGFNWCYVLGGMADCPSATPSSLSPGDGWIGCDSTGDLRRFFALVTVFTIFQPVITLPLELLFAFILKKLIIGRFREDEFPVWSYKYLQWWTASLLIHVLNSAHEFISRFGTGTPIIVWFYRLMGAKIGTGVDLRIPLEEIDLVEIGSHSTISQRANLHTHFFKDGKLVLKKVVIGEGVHIGEDCNIAGGAVIPNRCKLLPLTQISAGQKLKTGAVVQGNPAVELSSDEEKENEYASILEQHEKLQSGECAERSTWVPYLRVMSAILLELLISIWTMAPELALLMGSASIRSWVSVLDLRYLIPFSFAMGFAGFWFELLGLIFCKHLFLGRASEGSFTTDSSDYIKHELRMRLMEKLYQAGDLRPVVETRMMPWVLRALGAEIGNDCEISNGQYEPDLLKMGDFCMVADGVWMGSGIEHAGYYTNSKRTFGSHVFVGNLAVISPITREVPSNTTIGNLTFCPAIPKGNCIYLGSPPFEMPKPVTSEEAADQFEQQPWYMDVARALHNVFKISIPRGLDQAFMWALVKCIYASCEGARLKLPGKLSCVEVWWWTPLIFVSFAVAYTLVPILLKWSLVGMYGVCWLFCCKSAKMHMMWSSWMWRDEIHYEVSQMITSRLNPFLAGTPFMGWFFQLCGARIGSRSLFMYGHSMSEHDLVTIGDNVICEGYLQAHSFEGRKYQLDEVKIGHNCTIGINSTVMRSSELENGVTVGDLSLVMKGDRLEAGLAYVGLPAQAIL